MKPGLWHASAGVGRIAAAFLALTIGATMCLAAPETQPSTAAGSPSRLPAGIGAGDWPNWRGPYSNGSVDDWPGGVVDHPDQARLLWESEERELPGTDGPRWNGGIVSAGGYADVIVVKGRVYLNYAIANSSAVDEGLKKMLLEGKARIAEKAQFTEKEAQYVASAK